MKAKTHRRVVVGGSVVVVGVFLSGAACPQRFAAATTRARGPVPSAFVMPTRPLCAGELDARALDDGAAAVVVANASAGAAVSGDAVAAPLAVSAARPGVVSSDPVVSVFDANGVVGVAASLQNTELVWVFDSEARLRGVRADDDGTPRLSAELSLPPVFVEPADIELGPCPDLSGPCIYLADTGNVDGARDEVSVYAVPEPMISAEATAALGAVAVVTFPAMWVMHLRFPDDEAVHSTGLAVAPDGASLVLFEGGVPQPRAFIARAPWTIMTPDDGDDDNDGPMQLSLWASIDSDDEVLSATFHWSGQRILVSGTATLAELAVTRGDSGLLDATLSPEPSVLVELGSSRAWALGYGEGGRDLVGVSGDDDGAAFGVVGCVEAPAVAEVRP